MSRSLYKMPHLSQTLIHALQKNAKKKNITSIKVFSRSSTITPDLIGYQVQIHNGRGFANLKISPNIIGYKFGSFAVTKRSAIYRKQKK